VVRGADWRHIHEEPGSHIHSADERDSLRVVSVEPAGVSIRDTGPGIPEDEVPVLFTRFFRGVVGRASGTPGTGLGLSIAKEIVVRHGGTIELSANSEGQGAEFTIWIPAQPDYGSSDTP